MASGQDAPSTTIADTGSPPSAALDRRQLLGGGVLLGAMVVTPLAIWSRLKGGESGEATDAQRRLLTIVSDLVIPATNTPGAVAAGVPAFLELALSHGLEGTRARPGDADESDPLGMIPPAGGLHLIDALRDALDLRARGDFLNASAARQEAALDHLDAESYAQEGGGDTPWRKIKGLILDGYYTSEIGASQELHYELVPGRFDPDLPLPSHNRSWSSDWTAVDFG